MNHLTLPLDRIKVEGRIREDLGDVEGLAASIRDNGLIQPIVVEEVRESQDSNTYIYQLRAGGRRYTAYTLLNANKVSGGYEDTYASIPCVLLNEMPAHQRVKIELEENLRRKDMSWREKVEGIVKYHKAAKLASLLEGEKWSQSMTGDLLNLDQASVSIAFKVYEEIEKKNERVTNADSLTEALKVIAGDALDAAQAERMRRITLQRAEQAAKASQLAYVNTGVTLGGARPLSLPLLGSSIVARANPETASDKIQLTLADIASFYHEGNAIDLLPVLAKTTVINHIICDPPYAIEMSNLSQTDSVERVSETHTVAGNLDLIPKFLRVAFNCIAEDGFLCMWYDLDHHEKIKNWAEEIGWIVTRWPLVWCKTSNCSNQAAQCNITKATEVCYIMRRSPKSIIKKKQTLNYVLARACSTSTHPFPKPKEVWDYLIETVSLEGQTIIDPFAGEGSALAAIFQAKRTPIGVELDAKHIASGLGYIQDKLNKKSILDDLLTSSIL